MRADDWRSKEDRSPRTHQLVADLAAGCPATDHEHGAVRQVLRSAVARRIGLQHRRRNALGELRDARPLERPSGDDDVTGVDRPVRDG